MSPKRRKTDKGNVVQRRPAESSGVASSIALLIGYALGVKDAGVLVAIGVVIGFVPAAITWITNLVRGECG